jgi:ribosome-binding factor A
MRRNHRRRGESRSDPLGHAGTQRRHDLQLGRQAERIIALALAELDDPLLEELALVGVHVGSGGALTVELLAPAGTDRDTLGLVRERIAPQRHWLRAELARSIQRRRVPELSFLIDALPAQGSEPATGGEP